MTRKRPKNVARATNPQALSDFRSWPEFLDYLLTRDINVDIVGLLAHALNDTSSTPQESHKIDQMIEDACGRELARRKNPAARAPGESFKAWYPRYLDSPQWHRRRNEALSRARHRCDRCGARDNLEVHHRSYERVGNEHPDDLQVLCRRCHKRHHGIKR